MPTSRSRKLEVRAAATLLWLARRALSAYDTDQLTGQPVNQTPAEFAHWWAGIAPQCRSLLRAAGPGPFARTAKGHGPDVACLTGRLAFAAETATGYGKYFEMPVADLPSDRGSEWVAMAERVKVAAESVTERIPAMYGGAVQESACS